jgi:hypothetical protein
MQPGPIGVSSERSLAPLRRMEDDLIQHDPGPGAFVGSKKGGRFLEEPAIAPRSSKHTTHFGESLSPEKVSVSKRSSGISSGVRQHAQPP